jgi:precorrin-6Y C5,15-methyltransferase (decarboxylating)
MEPEHVGPPVKAGLPFGRNMQLKGNAVTVIGTGMCPQDLTKIQEDVIRKADILIGDRRQLAYFNGLAAEKKEIDEDLETIVAYIRKKMRSRRIVVLVYGDPLFHGIGATLTRVLDDGQLVISPNVTSVATAFSRINIPWHDARIVNLHGRGKMNAALLALLENSKVVVLTDPDHTPAHLAEGMCRFGLVDFRLCVFEQLGMPGERFVWCTPDETAGMTFTEPNLVVCLADAPHAFKNACLHLGVPDHHFAQRNGLITQSEVRAVNLAKLRLRPHHVLWDLGAGNGSVSIEASLLVRTGRIIAVEKNPQRIRQIKANKHRFRAFNVEIVQVVLPAGLMDLPTPDRIFIGGGGRNLGKIMAWAGSCLKPGVRMVVNTDLMDSMQMARQTFRTLGYDTEVVQVQINTSRNMLGSQRLAAQNPVWIVTGWKEA